MADKNETDLLDKSPFNKLRDTISSGMRKIYQRTYFSTPDNKESREGIMRDINTHLDQIISSNLDQSGDGNISRLLRRIRQEQNNQDTVAAFKNVFEDRTLMNSVFTSYSQNRYLYDYDAEIDTVLKYMPKLTEALNVLKDNVLSTDNFSKDFISAVDISDLSNDDLFSKRLEELKKYYNLLENFEKWYMDTSKYGEAFIYVIPYNRAVARIIRDRDASMSFGRINLEAGEFKLGNVTRMPSKFTTISEGVLKSFGTIEIELNMSGCITSVLEEAENNIKTRQAIHEQSVAHVFEETVVLEEKPPAAKVVNNKPISIDDTNVAVDRGDDSNMLKHLDKFSKKHAKGKLISDDEMDEYIDSIEKGKEVSSDDGVIDLNKIKEKKLDSLKDVPGCIVKQLDRHNVIPIILEKDICLGYYYFEFNDDAKDTLFNNGMRISNPMATMTTGIDLNTANDQLEKDKALRYISSELSKYIDANFVKRNQDLKKEIYAILKYNQIYNNAATSRMRITFIPPDDMHHFYFNLDEHTKRGKSDLHESLLPAKLYSAMYITTSIMTMTRGYDKRVFYVNPGIEANLTEALMNVIEQVKQGNFGIRQIRNNLNQVLNIQGRFNDYFILKSPNGDSPVNMEVINGQNIEPKTELMNLLEEMAINPTSVPIEIVQTRMNSMDYAIQLTMSNSKFLRVVFKRQSRVNEFFSRLLTKVYNYHFRNNDMITFTLPPPTFLSVTNNTQYFDNLNNYATHIVEIEWDGDPNDENGKLWFMKEIKRKMAGTYYNKDFIEETKRKAKQMSTIFPLVPKGPEG